MKKILKKDITMRICYALLILLAVFILKNIENKTKEIDEKTFNMRQNVMKKISQYKKDNETYPNILDSQYLEDKKNAENMIVSNVNIDNKGLKIKYNLKNNCDEKIAILPFLEMKINDNNTIATLVDFEEPIKILMPKEEIALEALTSYVERELIRREDYKFYKKAYKLNKEGNIGEYIGKIEVSDEKK